MFKFGKDEARCSGCRICQMICAAHNLAECNPNKAFIEIEGHFPKPGGYTIKIIKGCTLCGECVKICPSCAIFEKTDAGGQK